MRTWGSEGDDDGQFDIPQSVSVGGNGNVYVADFNNNQIARVVTL